MSLDTNSYKQLANGQLKKIQTYGWTKLGLDVTENKDLVL